MTSLLAANQLQDDLFFIEINCKDVGISKLFKLLLSLCELKGNGTVVMGTIIT